MSRIEEVLLPQFGMGMTEGEIVEWLKESGDRVVEDEPIAVIETAKVETELGAPYTGQLEEILVPPGRIVPVGAVLARMRVD